VGDLREIARKLVELAKAGDVAAAKVVLDRTLGPPVEWDLLERLERLESLLGGRGTPGRP
jgi:class 3 adenylate cyclase